MIADFPIQHLDLLAAHLGVPSLSLTQVDAETDEWAVIFPDGHEDTDLLAVLADFDDVAPPPAPSPTDLVIQAVLMAPDCPPGVRDAILQAQGRSTPTE